MPLPESPPENKSMNKATVKAIYRALTNHERDTVGRLVAADIEWWFHGPPHCQHMMRVLTGELDQSAFKFKPRSFTAIGDRVIVEGWEGVVAYWVHVWTVKDGLITQFREYFNTCLTVTDLRLPVWESKPHEDLYCMFPGHVLAI